MISSKLHGHGVLTLSIFLGASWSIILLLNLTLFSTGCDSGQLFVLITIGVSGVILSVFLLDLIVIVGDRVDIEGLLLLRNRSALLAI